LIKDIYYAELNYSFALLYSLSLSSSFCDSKIFTIIYKLIIYNKRNASVECERVSGSSFFGYTALLDPLGRFFPNFQLDEL